MISIIGIPLGFYGYLFPGNINLMVLELYRAKKVHFLVFVLFLIVLFESLYCWFSLNFLVEFKSSEQFNTQFEIAAYILLASMGVWMIFENKKEEVKIQRNMIFRGIFSIVFNPQQIPFWLIFGIIVSKYIPLHVGFSNLFLFIFFNCLGTLLAMFAYMYFGIKLFKFLNLNLARLNKVMGLVYILIAVFSYCFA